MSVFKENKGELGGSMGMGATQKLAPMPVSATKADNIREHKSMSPDITFSNKG